MSTPNDGITYTGNPQTWPNVDSPESLFRRAMELEYERGLRDGRANRRANGWGGYVENPATLQPGSTLMTLEERVSTLEKQLFEVARRQLTRDESLRP